MVTKSIVLSLSRMVTVRLLAPLKVATPVIFVRVKEKVSLPSMLESFRMGTRTVREVTPGPKVSVPLVAE